MALTIGALLGVSPGTADAASCAINLVQAPRVGQTNVPTNTLLWGYAGGNLQLVGPSGEVVSLVERAIIARSWSFTRVSFPVLVPTGPLQPYTRYSIEVDSGESRPLARNEFVTGAGPADSAPEVPVLVSAEPRLETSRGRWLDLQFEDIRDRGLILIGTADGAVTELASVEGLLLDGPPTPAAAAEAPLLEWIADVEQLSVGLEYCSLWPEGAPDALTASFGVFDLAGNFSGWGDVSLELPSEAEAQALADQEAAEAAAAAAEADRVAEANLARLAAASRDDGCALAPASSGGPSALAALALGASALWRRRQQVRGLRARR